MKILQTSQYFFCGGEVLAFFLKRNFYDFGKSLLDFIDLSMFGEVVEVFSKIGKQYFVNEVHRTRCAFDISKNVFDLFIQDPAL